MYALAQERFESYGLKQYEISAFAKEGYQSIHNTGYWEGRPFIGFGPSAFSYYEGKRFKNVSNLRAYHKSLSEGMTSVDFVEELEVEKKRRELFVIGLRMMKGCQMDELFKEEVEKLVSDGFLQVSENKIVTLTKKGILFYDDVASELI